MRYRDLHLRFLLALGHKSPWQAHVLLNLLLMREGMLARTARAATLKLIKLLCSISQGQATQATVRRF